MDAQVARLDEAYEILADPQRSLSYGSYLQHTDTGPTVVGPEVFGALGGTGSRENSAVEERNETLSLALGGEALGALAEVVIAAHAPGDGLSREAAVGIVPGELPPWMNRPTPTGEVPVNPTFPAEAREENFLDNLEVQNRLQGLHEHLAAADLIRKERNELLRQVVKVKAELEMRASAEADLRKSLSASDRDLQDARRALEHQVV